MNQATKRIFAIILALVVCFHFVMIFIYCSPKKNHDQKLDFVKNLYVYPLFYQNWALFVPTPSVERKLFIRYKAKEGFSKWEDVLSKEIIHHKQNRLLGNDAIVLLLSNSLIYELNYLDEKPSFITNENPINKEFKVLRFEIEHYLRLNYKLSAIDYEVLMVSSGRDRYKSYYIKTLSVK